MFERLRYLNKCQLYKYIALKTITGQIANVIRRLLQVREVKYSNTESINSLTGCQRFATFATLMCRPCRKTTELGIAHS